VAYEVEWAESAIDDLIEQLDFVARDSPSYASSLSLKAEKAAASLDHFPYRGRAVPEYEDQTIREIQVSSYRLIYQVTAKRVWIIGFVHVARDLTRLLERAEE
jgi:plasmid stabilization system protein ParE